MSCIFRVVGTALDVDALAQSVPLAPYRIDRKGERSRPHSQVNLTVHEASCLHFDVEGASDCQLPEQVEAATAWLTKYARDIESLMNASGVESGTLDFKINVNWEDLAAHFDYLPPELLRVAGALKLGIELSHYSLTDEE